MFYLPASAGITLFTVNFELVVEEMTLTREPPSMLRLLNFQMAPEISPMLMSGGPQVSVIDWPVKVRVGKPIGLVPIEGDGTCYKSRKTPPSLCIFSLSLLMYVALTSPMTGAMELIAAGRFSFTSASSVGFNSPTTMVKSAATLPCLQEKIMKPESRIICRDAFSQMFSKVSSPHLNPVTKTF